jgi:hypothetical protein
MINANEIRIGNWLRHKAEWSYRQPPDFALSYDFPFNEFDFQWNEDDWHALGECTLSLDNVEPIPLTYEWLERSGFKRFMGSFAILGPMVGYIHREGDNSIGGYFGTSDEFQWRLNDVCILARFKYVHQLQNLYFVSTGEELCQTTL